MTDNQMLIDRLGLMLEELVTINRHILIAIQQLNDRGGSSVEIDSNGRAGETKIKVKRYSDSEAPVDEAVADYAQAMAHLTDGYMDGWQKTVETMRAERGNG